MAAVVTPTSRAQKEQSVVYDKVKQANTFYHEYKAGTTKIDIPTSNDDINARVDTSVKHIEEFQNSSRGKELGEKNTQVLEDLKRVLKDEKLILDTKNNDEQVQKVVKSGYAVAKDITHNPAVRELLLRWKNELQASAKAGNWMQTLKTGGDVFAKMREVEAFLELVVELGTLMKGMADKEATKEQREKVLQEMRNSLRVLSGNNLWNKMIAQHEIPEAYKNDAKNIVQNAADEKHVSTFLKDAQALLQAVVGPQVDLEPFVRTSTYAYEALLTNTPFISLLRDTQELLLEMSNNRALADEPATQQLLSALMDRLEFEITLLKNNTEFHAARAEGEKIVVALKNDPVNLQVYENFRKLIKDADSDFLGAFRAFLVPIIMEHLNNIPVQALNSTAKIMGSKVDFHIENVRLNANDFIPENFRFKVEYEMEGKAQNFSVDHQKILLHVEVNNIQIHLSDVMWSYVRHSTPKMEDRGRMKFDTTHKGISLKLVVEVYPSRTQDIFVVKTARCYIDKWNIQFTESKHNAMYHMLLGVSGSKIKKEVRKAVEAKLKEIGKTAEAKAYKVAKDGKERLNKGVVKVKQNIKERREKLSKKAKKESVTTPPKTSDDVITKPVSTDTTATEGAEIVVVEKVVVVEKTKELVVKTHTEVNVAGVSAQ